MLNLPPILLFNDLQRTEEWFKQRLGRFTGSRIEDLMSCSRSSAKMEWGRPEKTIDLGDAAKKYIFEKAMERRRNKVIQTPTSAAMKYGTENESLVKELLKMNIEEVGFIEFIKGIAGASADGKIGNDMGLEIKCAANWSGVYNRMCNSMDENHIDFWQLQAEMLALKVNKILYVVAEPSENLFEPNITDIQKLTVPASSTHQNEIIKRCILGNNVIELFNNGMSFDEAINEACTKIEL